MRSVCLACVLLVAVWAQAQELTIVERALSINGREAVIYTLVQSNGEWELRLKKGELFDVQLSNDLIVPTSIHWHGLLLPNNQDGVAFITQFPIYPGQGYRYQFQLVQAGTFWMHSHFGLQEQLQLSAPLIIEDPHDAELADQEVIFFFSDFSFQSPQAILQQLRCSMPKMSGDNDLVDVHYDALLVNHRTLQNPEVITVKPQSLVRLRCINASSSTNCWIQLGALKGEAVAVDGNRIEPFAGVSFELAVAQRIDLLVRISEEGSFPILAQGEGTQLQAGLILTTSQDSQFAISETTTTAAAAFTNSQEKRLRALTPLLPRKVDRQLLCTLGGKMSSYSWTINGQSWPESTPLVVQEGERVQLVFDNQSSMAHPMHLHGHVFQVTAIDDTVFNGAMRDTVLVPAHSKVTIEFDADQPGVWPLHCHLLYHQAAGMFTVLRYANFQQSL